MDAGEGTDGIPCAACLRLRGKRGSTRQIHLPGSCVRGGNHAELGGGDGHGRGAKKTAAAAISSGRPIRLSGIAATNCALVSSGSAVLSIMGVSIGPGLKVLNRMPRSVNSRVQVRT